MDKIIHPATIPVSNSDYFNVGAEIYFSSNKTFWDKVKEFFFGKEIPQTFMVVEKLSDTSISVMPKNKTGGNNPCIEHF